MTFTKLSEENKQRINNYKEQYGNENLGSYRALLMRSKSHEEAVSIINSRKQIQPVENKKAEVFKPATIEESKPKPKRQPKKQKVEDAPVLAIKNTPETAPAPKAKATRKKNNEDTTVELIL